MKNYKAKEHKKANSQREKEREREKERLYLRESGDERIQRVKEEKDDTTCASRRNLCNYHKKER